MRREAPTLDRSPIRITPYCNDMGPCPPAAQMQRIVRSNNDEPLQRMGDWT